MKMIATSNGPYFMVSDRDYWMRCFRWHYDAAGYVATSSHNKGKRTARFHQIIFPGMLIDHKDLDKRNNVRSNLRKATRQQNNQNMPLRKTSITGYKGVCWCKHKKRYLVRVAHKFVGYFTCKHEAARAYNVQALKMFGKFARINTIKESK